MGKYNWHKAVAAMVLASVFSLGSATAAPARHIPYPAGLDTLTEGASAAPAEINHKASPYFKKLDFYKWQSIPGRRVMLTNYATYQQSREYTCGPAAALTVLYWYGNKQYDEMALAQAMHTQGYPIGTSLENMANFFTELGWQVKNGLQAEKISRYEDFRDFLLEPLSHGRPVLVENVEWGGHWRVIIGYDNMGTESTLDDILIFADPYDTCDHQQDGYAVGNGQKFFSMWFDHNMLPEKERYQPWIIAWPHN